MNYATDWRRSVIYAEIVEVFISDAFACFFSGRLKNRNYVGLGIIQFSFAAN